MKSSYCKLIFIVILLGFCIVGVQATAFSSWSAYGDAWKATNDTHTLIMWNATGTHSWLATGNASSVEYLVVAGGGGGGNSISGSGGGGGGAGGMKEGTLSVSSSITVVVGPGGATHNTGSSSSFSSISTTGGGYGGAGTDGKEPGGNGGSGGGGGGDTNAGMSGGPGTGVSGEGNNGGPAYSTAGYGIGGGGKTSAGSEENGGAGKVNTITGNSVTYATGGGAKRSTGTGTDGTPNTGNGGEGAAQANYGGSGGSGIVIISYLNRPIVSFTTNVTTGDSPLSIQFTDTSTDTPTSWKWMFANLTYPSGEEFSILQNPTHVFVAGNYTINLTATNTGGSNISTQITWINVTVPAGITSNFTISNTSGFEPLLTHFTDTSTTTNAMIDAWNWSFGDGEVSATQSPDHTFVNNGTYSVNLTITNISYSLVSTKLATIIVFNQPPIADFTASNLSGIPPLVVQFTDTSIGENISVWNWSFGDGNVSALQNPLYTFENIGEYQVNLTVINDGGSSTKLKNITVAMFNADFTSNKTSGPIPFPVLFIDTSIGNYDTWNWSVDDGTLHWYNKSIYADRNLEYTFNNVGSWRVNLSVQNISISSPIYSASMNITATNVPPVAAFTSSAIYGTTATNFIFNDTSTGDNIYAWNWSFGDGNVSASRNVTHQFPLGTYAVNLTVTNDGGSSSNIQTIIVSTFTTSFTATPQLGVVPLSVTFSETSSGLLPDSYYWEFGDGSTSTDQNPTHIYNDIGIFGVNHGITNGSTISWSNQTDFIKTEIGNITPSFTSSNTTSIDPPLVVRFTDTSSITNASPATYYWVFGDGSVSSDQNPLHIFTSYGNFQSNVTVSNATQGISKTSQITTFTIISNYPANISYNFVMNAVYPTTIRVKDSETLALINGVKLTGDGIEHILDNGILSTYYEYGSHTFDLEANGYYTKTTSLFVVGNSTFTIELTPSTSSQTQTTFWSPQNVEFLVVDENHQSLPNTLISATAIQSTLPGGYSGCLQTLQNAYGIPQDQAAIMLNSATIMNGTTDATGGLTFLMLPTFGYTIDVGNGNFTTTIYPKDTYYIIQTSGSSYTQPQNVESNYNSTSYDTLNISEPDINHIKMQLFYYDATAKTNAIQFWVKLIDNDTYINTQNVSVDNLKGPILLNYTVENTRGQQFRWGYDATRI